MRLSRTILIVSFVIIAALGLIVFSQGGGCKADYKVICQFVEEKETEYQGVWFLGDRATADLEIQWALDDISQEIIHFSAAAPIFHFITDGSTIVIQDIEDGKWWRQSYLEYADYQIKLPFDPAHFIQKLKEQLSTEQTMIVSERAPNCDQGACSSFRIKSDIDEYRIIFVEDELSKIEILSTVPTTTIEIARLESEVMLPQRNISDAPQGENIVLKALNQRRPEQNSMPSFVREFEQSRIEAEQQGIGVDVPQYLPPVTPSSTPSE